jgi:hypothetical protein
MTETKKQFGSLMSSGPTDPLAAIFAAWRLWLVGAFLGALVAGLAFSTFPPDYRAQAVVVVDNNLEDAWQYFPDRQLFQFLRRETDRLVVLAWSDEVLSQINSDLPIADLRDSALDLSQPSDGGWNFYADSPDPQKAVQMANDWAQAFISAARQATSASPEMQALRSQLNELLLTDPGPDNQRLLEITDELTALAEVSQGVSPYVELHLSLEADLPTERGQSLATYLLLGSLTGAILLALYSLLSSSESKEKH